MCDRIIYCNINDGKRDLRRHLWQIDLVLLHRPIGNKNIKTSFPNIKITTTKPFSSHYIIKCARSRVSGDASAKKYENKDSLFGSFFKDVKQYTLLEVNYNLITHIIHPDTQNYKISKTTTPDLQKRKIEDDHSFYRQICIFQF